MHNLRFYILRDQGKYVNSSVSQSVKFMRFEFVHQQNRVMLSLKTKNSN